MNNLKTSIVLYIFYLSTDFSSSYAHPILTASQNHYRSNTNHYYQEKLKRERRDKSRRTGLQQKRKSGRKSMLASMNLEEKENFLQMESRSRIKGKLNNELDMITRKFLKRIESLWLNRYLPEVSNMVKNEKDEAYLNPENLDDLKNKNNSKSWIDSLDQLVEKYYYLIDEELEEIAYEIDRLSWDIDDSMIVDYIENQKEKCLKEFKQLSHELRNKSGLVH
ncbi:MAG: hypothetical protein AB8G05_25780 [Oligoflexales bacterium]